MEHILQFGINIDDETIRKAVMARAENDIIEDLKKNARDELFTIDRGYYGRSERIIGFRQFAEDMFKDFLDEHKEIIIERASDKLADKMSRSKNVREAMIKEVKERN